jgi:hypothetical protein
MEWSGRALYTASAWTLDGVMKEHCHVQYIHSGRRHDGHRQPARLSDQQLLLFCGYGEPHGSRTNDAISYSVIVITKRLLRFYSGRDFVEVGGLMSDRPLCWPHP